jgi:hypothetical protein
MSFRNFSGVFSEGLKTLAPDWLILLLMFATGEIAMRFITSDWVLTETDAPATLTMNTGKVRSHEEVFRSALASYMAAYIAVQHKRRTAKIAARES